MDLNEIFVFVKVVEHGSFIAAANATSIPQATVSRKIATLEQRLGARLIHRTTRAFSLTDSGEAFYQHCAHLIEDIAQAEQVVRSSQLVPSGKLRLAVIYEFGITFLTPLISEFLNRYPKVTIEAELTSRQVDLVSEGYDLAIVPGPIRDSSLIVKKLGMGHAALCASPHYLKKQGTPLTIKGLKNHDCICHTADLNGDKWHFQTKSGITRIDVSGKFYTNDRQVMKQAALADLGIALMPAFMCAEEIKVGKLIPLLAEWVPQDIDINLLYPSKKHLSIAVRKFIDYTCEMAPLTFQAQL